MGGEKNIDFLKFVCLRLISFNQAIIEQKISLAEPVFCENKRGQIYLLFISPGDVRCQERRGCLCRIVLII